VTSFFRTYSLVIGVSLTAAIAVVALVMMVVRSYGRGYRALVRRVLVGTTLALVVALVADVVGRYRAFS
jgi:hypothetical protein